MGSRGAALRLLAGVAVMRDDSRNGAGACTLSRINHDEQLHERVVDVVASLGAHD